MRQKKHPKNKKHIKADQAGPKKSARSPDTAEPKRLEIVLKSDFMGSQEAVHAAISELNDPQVEIKVIYSGVGAVTKSDLQMALTGSKLILGFNVDVMPQIKRISQEQGVEIRLYNVIYRLLKDLKEISGNLIPAGEEEEITGEAEVIALFKSSRKGIILGCDVSKGTLALGKNFRIISAMGPVYKGKIESLQIEKNAVKEAKAGQQVGLKLLNFKDVKMGDLVECFKIRRPDSGKIWQPRGGVFRFES